jgi:hypothetical protein
MVPQLGRITGMMDSEQQPPIGRYSGVMKITVDMEESKHFLPKIEEIFKLSVTKTRSVRSKSNQQPFLQGAGAPQTLLKLNQ